MIRSGAKDTARSCPTHGAPGEPLAVSRCALAGGSWPEALCWAGGAWPEPLRWAGGNRLPGQGAGSVPFDRRRTPC